MVRPLKSAIAVVSAKVVIACIYSSASRDVNIGKVGLREYFMNTYIPLL